MSFAVYRDRQGQLRTELEQFVPADVPVCDRPRGARGGEAVSSTTTELSNLVYSVRQLVEAQREATAMVNEHWEKLHRRNEEMDSFRTALEEVVKERDDAVLRLKLIEQAENACVELMDVRAERDRLRNELTGALAQCKDQWAMREEAERERDRLREALREAATSLDTVSHAGSRHPKSDLETFSDIRGYAASRARAAREALGERQP